MQGHGNKPNELTNWIKEQVVYQGQKFYGPAYIFPEKIQTLQVCEANVFNV